MVFLGSAVQYRIQDAVKRQAGPDAERLLLDTALDLFDRPLDRLTYAEVALLLTTVERYAPERLGTQRVAAFVRDFDRLQQQIERGLADRLLGIVSRYTGAKAPALLTAAGERLGYPWESTTTDHLAEPADALAIEATALLADGVIETLAEAVRTAGAIQPADLSFRLIALATQHLGMDGESAIRRICQSRLEVDLEDVSAVGLSVLRAAILRDGATTFGERPATLMVTATRAAITSPAASLRETLRQIAARDLGPAGPDVIARACAARGLPFEALDHEHLMLVAEAMRLEAAPLIGRKAADQLAGRVRRLLTGR